MNTLAVIKERYDRMTKSERKVASWFLGHPNDFAFFTLERVAQETGVSTTSVIRFCRSLGFSGFKNLQNSLREDIRYQKDLPFKFHETVEHSSEDELLSLTIRQDLSCISSTFKKADPKVLKKAVRLISEAERVYTLGMRESFSLAHYAYTRLLTVRRNAYLLDAGQNALPEPVLSLSSSDVCIVFLFHRYTKAVLRLLPVLREQGARILMITEEPFDQITEFSDLIIPCSVNAGGIKNTQAAPVCLMDYLCNAVAVENGENALGYLKKTEELFHRLDFLEE